MNQRRVAALLLSLFSAVHACTVPADEEDDGTGGSSSTGAVGEAGESSSERGGAPSGGGASGAPADLGGSGGAESQEAGAGGALVTEGGAPSSGDGGSDGEPSEGGSAGASGGGVGEGWTGIRQDGVAQMNRPQSVSARGSTGVVIGGWSANRVDGEIEGAGFVARYDADGALTWAHRLVPDSGVSSSVHGVTLTEDGGAVFIGEASAALEGQTLAGEHDVVVGRYDRDGNLSWVTQFGSTANDQGHSVKQGSDGNLVITGFANGQLPFETDPVDGRWEYVAKLDALNGDILWFTRQTVGTRLALDSNDNVYLAGQARVAKLGPDGTAVGAFDLEPTLTEYAMGLVPDTAFVIVENSTLAVEADGGLLFLAATLAVRLEDGPLETLLMLVAVDPVSGALLWIQDVLPDLYPDGTTPRAVYEVQGVSASPDGTQVVLAADGYVVSYVRDGVFDWFYELPYRFEPGSPDDFYSTAGGLDLDAHGGLFVAGTTDGAIGTPGGNFEDAWFVAKLGSASGLLQ